jgi:threonine-phosphate decarboxylase
VAAWLGVDPALVLDLSASLNPEAPDVARVVASAAGAVGRYPDPGRATAALAEAIGVERERLVLTNGGAEAIALLAGVEPIGWVEPPEFSLYVRHLARLHPSGMRWRSNPSNPLGRLARPAAGAGVWDEAFWPLATGTWTRGDEQSWRIGSLTKLWACPGLRLGYLIAPDTQRARAVRDRQPRWAVNGLACAAVEPLLAATDLGRWAAVVRKRRGALVTELRRRGLAVHDTEACWVLVDRLGLREALAPHGVLVRDCASFGLPGTARIAVPGDTGLDRLLAALDRVLAAGGERVGGPWPAR